MRRRLGSGSTTRAVAALFVAYLLGGYRGAQAAVASAEAAQPIEQIEVTGNTRTKEDVITGALGVRTGELVSASDLPEFERRVLNLQLFSAVQVGLRQGTSGAVLGVDVKERWTLLPVPFFSSSEGRTKVGLFLLESNLFGRKKMLAAGGIYSNRGSRGFGFYRDPAIGGSRWTGSLMMSVGVDEREHVPSDVILDSYRDERFEASALLGYRMTNELEVSAGLFTRIARPKARDGFTAPASPDSEVYGLSAVAEYKGQNFRHFFNEGLAVRLRFDEGLGDPFSTIPYRRVRANATYTHALWGDHTVTLAGNLEVARGDQVVDAVILGGNTGSRGFEDDGLWGDEAGSVTAEYQLPLWKPGWGVLTANAFVDMGVVRWQDDPLSYAAPGAGVRLYLRNVAIPALGVDVARGPTTHEPVVSVAVGFGM